MNKLKRLAAYIEAVANEDTHVSTYRQYEQDIKSVTADELFDLFYDRLKNGENQKDVLKYLDKLIHVFYQSLKHKLVEVPKDSFLDHLDQENQQLEERLNAIKNLLKEHEIEKIHTELLPRFKELLAFDAHYQKKENILFPFLEKKDKKFEGFSIMWSLHDQTRRSLKEVIRLLSSDTIDVHAINQAIGRYFFDAFGLIQKEESILFVVTMERCSANELEHMREQSFEYDFCFIKTPTYRKVETLHLSSDQWLYSTDTGAMTHDQLTMFLSVLPFDCTLIDEHNKVIYFNKPKDRFFPRSPAVIGRDVRNCHPADSVDVVDRIIDAFRENKKDVATFWIDFKGKKLLIQYFALKDDHNTYKGTVEVTQDITEILTIEGQRRLLDWD